LAEIRKAQTLKDWYIAFFEGAEIYSDEPVPRFLGRISDRLSPDSIFNEIGPYGDRFGAVSIWNEFGNYGGQFSPYSPFNQFGTSPPFIIKDNRRIGRLTINEFFQGAISPYWLK